MIYTVTLNPSLDYRISPDTFEYGKTNRSREELLLPGGKGINVSLVLKNLGIISRAMGFLAGFTGKEIERMLELEGICGNWTYLQDGYSRINIKWKESDGTEINASGPVISDRALAQMTEAFQTLQAGDYLVLAGSLPRGIPEDFYKRAAESLSEKGVRIAADLPGRLLKELLPLHPFLIKPNLQELEEFFDTAIRSVREAADCAVRLQRMGAEHVMISMGGQGALYTGKDEMVYQNEVPEGTLINAVGSGDSMVAGFLAGQYQEMSSLESFRLACAAGSASAYSEWLASGPDILALYDRIKEPQRLQPKSRKDRNQRAAEIVIEGLQR